MTSLVYPDQPEMTSVWRAVLVSLGLHALVVIFYPMISHIELPPVPERLEIELFTVKAPAPSPSVQPVAPPVEDQRPLEPPKTPPVTVSKPPVPPAVETPKPVLAAPASKEAEYRVPEQAAPAKVEPAPAVPPATTAATTSSEASGQVATTEAATRESSAAPASSAPAHQESEALTASDQDAWGDYGEQLRALVNKGKHYPAIAIRRHLEGEAMVVAQFVHGELVKVSLEDSSKHVPLDEEAMRMVKKAIAQLGVKESLKKKTFKITIPVSFKLE